MAAERIGHFQLGEQLQHVQLRSFVGLMSVAAVVVMAWVGQLAAVPAVVQATVNCERSPCVTWWPQSTRSVISRPSVDEEFDANNSTIRRMSTHTHTHTHTHPLSEPLINSSPPDLALTIGELTRSDGDKLWLRVLHALVSESPKVDCAGSGDCE